MYNGLKKLLAALFVGCCVVLQSSAAIVSMNPSNGQITWNVQSLTLGIVWAIAYALSGLMVIVLIRTGWGIIRDYLGFASISDQLLQHKIKSQFNKVDGLRKKRVAAIQYAAKNGYDCNQAERFAENLFSDRPSRGGYRRSSGGRGRRRSSW